jgi:AcrR family transcriptional regulator
MTKQKTAERQRSPRVTRNRERTRQEIIHAAREILHEGGIDAITLASVAGKLGMTKQALYHYFASKEALIKSLVTMLLDAEIHSITSAIGDSDSTSGVLGTMIRAFYKHYIDRLDALRTVYCQSQLHPASELGLDKDALRDEINPRTNNLFDLLQERLSNSSMSAAECANMRRLAYTAWLAALGLLTMLGVADATRDPLIHSDQDLLDTLADVFNDAATHQA